MSAQRDPMTWPEYLSAIKQRVAKATKGPWKALSNPEQGLEWVQAICPQGGSVCTALDAFGLRQPRKNASFIAHARTDIERLVARVEELEGHLQSCVALLEIGKRDLTNPKYDGYFTSLKEARAVLNAKVEGET